MVLKGGKDTQHFVFHNVFRLKGKKGQTGPNEKGQKHEKAKNIKGPKMPKRGPKHSCNKGQKELFPTYTKKPISVRNILEFNEYDVNNIIKNQNQH